jgi:hypothetical protein
MARTRSVVCHGCGERAWREPEDAWYDDKYLGRYIDAYDDDGKPICNWCTESDRSYPNAVVVFGPGHAPESIMIGDYLVENTSGFAVDEQLIFQIFGRPVYHKTDGWRGYYEFVVPPGMTSIADGWYTGWATADDPAVSHKLDIYALQEALGEHGDKLPCEVYVLVTTTSNVFSQGMDIVVADADVEAFVGWLNEWAHLSVEDLDGALS